ncbi:MAG TPA: acyl-CoA dehydrogenase family protein [Solirubrobacteraceae bacterium]|nr:acyl-CoA dehydrogenase family protein [Solirubrobacteraceae bacterium]
MNLALSDEQELLREAARGTLSRVKTVEAARDALEDESRRPDLWATAVEAGWPGLLVSEQQGGAQLGAFDAMLVAEECGRVLAPVPLLGMLPATAILDAAGHESLPRIAAGELRPAYVPARPPSDLEPRWTVDPRSGARRADAPRPRSGGDDGDAIVLDGTASFVPDLPGAQLLVVVASTEGGEPVAAAIAADADGVSTESLWRYDATRPLGHVTFDGARAERLDVSAETLAGAWYLAHALIAAESIGAVQTCLDVSVQYAKERHTFGRPIGSYQSLKHELTEVLRRLENARGLQYYAGWAHGSKPDEFPLAASAARSAAGEALDFAARSMINVHGGIGATWEHDAPLFFRRAELSRRLLGGTGDATDRVASETLRTVVAS